MPELGLFLSWRDIEEFVEFVLQEGGALVPDLEYESDQYVVIRDSQSFGQLRRETSLFFILNDSYFLSPFEIRRITKRGKVVFYILQRSGGPTIDLFTGGDFRRSHQHLVGPSSLGYHPTYWNTTTHRNEKSPDSLIIFYKSLVRQIKKGAKRIKPGVRAYWVGKHAQGLVRNGAKPVGYEKKKIDL